MKFSGPLRIPSRELCPRVEHGDEVRMGAETAHCLGFAGNASAGYFVQTLGLDQGESHFPVQQRVLGQVDSLLAALAQESLPALRCIDPE